MFSDSSFPTIGLTLYHRSFEEKGFSLKKRVILSWDTTPSKDLDRPVAVTWSKLLSKKSMYIILINLAFSKCYQDVKEQICQKKRTYQLSIVKFA